MNLFLGAISWVINTLFDTEPKGSALKCHRDLLLLFFIENKIPLWRKNIPLLPAIEQHLKR